MKEKERYMPLEVEVIEFESEDVIMDSPTNNQLPISSGEGNG